MENEAGQQKKWTYGLLVLVIVYALVRSVIAAANKDFWYDEFLTLTVSSLDSLRAVWAALCAPLDGQPPLFYVIERALLGFSKKQEVALRLPSILALTCTLACVFAYARKRSGDLVAFLCIGFLLTTCLFQLYAVEARPYSLVMACFAFALVCYQRAPAPAWMTLLGLSLFTAQSLHYLAILSMVPFGLAEGAVWLKGRKFRPWVWGALVFGATPALIFWKLIAINKAYYGGPRFWARFQFSYIPEAYGEYLLSKSHLGAAIAAAAIVSVVAPWSAAFGSGTLRPRNGEDGSRKTDETSSALVEAIMLGTFVALPFLALVFAKVTHSGLTPRYVLPTILGITLAFGAALSRAGKRLVLLFGVFVVSSLGIQELHFWRFPELGLLDSKLNIAESAKFIERGSQGNLPIVFPNGMAMLELAHYAPPSFQPAKRFIYLTRDTDPTWPDTLDKGYKILERYMPLRVAERQAFTAAHSEFLLYGTDLENQSITRSLIEEGWNVRVVAADGHRAMYLASSAPNSR